MKRWAAHARAQAQVCARSQAWDTEADAPEAEAATEADAAMEAEAATEAEAAMEAEATTEAEALEAEALEADLEEVADRWEAATASTLDVGAAV